MTTPFAAESAAHDDDVDAEVDDLLHQLQVSFLGKGGLQSVSIRGVLRWTTFCNSCRSASKGWERGRDGEGTGAPAAHLSAGCG